MIRNHYPHQQNQDASIDDNHHNNSTDENENEENLFAKPQNEYFDVIDKLTDKVYPHHKDALARLTQARIAVTSTKIKAIHSFESTENELNKMIEAYSKQIGIFGAALLDDFNNPNNTDHCEVTSYEELIVTAGNDNNNNNNNAGPKQQFKTKIPTHKGDPNNYQPLLSLRIKQENTLHNQCIKNQQALDSMLFNVRYNLSISCTRDIFNVQLLSQQTVESPNPYYRQLSELEEQEQYNNKLKNNNNNNNGTNNNVSPSKYKNYSGTGGALVDELVTVQKLMKKCEIEICHPQRKINQELLISRSNVNRMLLRAVVQNTCDFAVFPDMTMMPSKPDAESRLDAFKNKGSSNDLAGMRVPPIQDSISISRSYKDYDELGDTIETEKRLIDQINGQMNQVQDEIAASKNQIEHIIKNGSSNNNNNNNNNNTNVDYIQNEIRQYEKRLQQNKNEHSRLTRQSEKHQADRDEMKKTLEKGHRWHTSTVMLTQRGYLDLCRQFNGNIHLVRGLIARAAEVGIFITIADLPDIKSLFNNPISIYAFLVSHVVITDREEAIKFGRELQDWNATMGDSKAKKQENERQTRQSDAADILRYCRQQLQEQQNNNNNNDNDSSSTSQQQLFEKYSDAVEILLRRNNNNNNNNDDEERLLDDIAELIKLDDLNFIKTVQEKRELGELTLVAPPAPILQSADNERNPNIITPPPGASRFFSGQDMLPRNPTHLIKMIDSRLSQAGKQNAEFNRDLGANLQRWNRNENSIAFKMTNNNNNNNNNTIIPIPRTVRFAMETVYSHLDYIPSNPDQYLELRWREYLAYLAPRVTNRSLTQSYIFKKNRSDPLLKSLLQRLDMFRQKPGGFASYPNNNNNNNNSNRASTNASPQFGDATIVGNNNNNNDARRREREEVYVCKESQAKSRTQHSTDKSAPRPNIFSQTQNTITVSQQNVNNNISDNNTNNNNQTSPQHDEVIAPSSQHPAKSIIAVAAGPRNNNNNNSNVMNTNQRDTNNNSNVVHIDVDEDAARTTTTLSTNGTTTRENINNINQQQQQHNNHRDISQLSTAAAATAAPSTAFRGPSFASLQNNAYTMMMMNSNTNNTNNQNDNNNNNNNVVNEYGDDDDMMMMNDNYNPSNFSPAARQKPWYSDDNNNGRMTNNNNNSKSGISHLMEPEPALPFGMLNQHHAGNTTGTSNNNNNKNNATNANNNNNSNNNKAQQQQVSKDGEGINNKHIDDNALSSASDDDDNQNNNNNQSDNTTTNNNNEDDDGSQREDSQRIEFRHHRLSSLGKGISSSRGRGGVVSSKSGKSQKLLANNNNKDTAENNNSSVSRARASSSRRRAKHGSRATSADNNNNQDENNNNNNNNSNNNNMMMVPTTKSAYYNEVSDFFVHQADRKTENIKFQISPSIKGDERKTAEQAIKQLQCTYIKGSNYHAEATHLVTAPGSPERTEKYLAFRAAGKIIVTVAYLLDSCDKGFLLKEDKYNPVRAVIGANGMSDSNNNNYNNYNFTHSAFDDVNSQNGNNATAEIRVCHGIKEFLQRRHPVSNSSNNPGSLLPLLTSILNNSNRNISNKKNRPFGHWRVLVFCRDYVFNGISNILEAGGCSYAACCPFASEDELANSKEHQHWLGQTCRRQQEFWRQRAEKRKEMIEMLCGDHQGNNDNNNNNKKQQTLLPNFLTRATATCEEDYLLSDIYYADVLDELNQQQQKQKEQNNNNNNNNKNRADDSSSSSISIIDENHKNTTSGMNMMSLSPTTGRRVGFTHILVETVLNSSQSENYIPKQIREWGGPATLSADKKFLVQVKGERFNSSHSRGRGMGNNNTNTTTDLLDPKSVLEDQGWKKTPIHSFEMLFLKLCTPADMLESSLASLPPIHFIADQQHQ